MTSSYRIAVIPGDGIGTEVMPEGLRVLDAVARRFGIGLQWDHFDFSSWPYFEKHGQMLPSDWKDRIGGHDAIYFGAVGMPDKIPDHVSLWGSLLLFRREFDQYINLRPARLMPGIVAPVVRRDGSPRQPGEIDMYIVRENTEGEYSSIGGRMFPGTPREIVMQETVMSRVGVDRVLKFAFELAQSRPKKHLTSATKSNGIAITMPYWDERVAEMAKNYPGVNVDKFHIDILTAHFVQRPDFFDVVVKWKFPPSFSLHRRIKDLRNTSGNRITWTTRITLDRARLANDRGRRKSKMLFQWQRRYALLLPQYPTLLISV